MDSVVASNTLTTVVVRVDPLMRDTSLYPATNEYRVAFDQTYNGVVCVDLEYASISTTEPIVSSRNDTFVYHVSAGGGRKSVTMEHGSYTAGELVTALNDRLLSAGDGLVASFEPTTGKVTFTHATSPFVIYANDSTSRNLLGLITSEPLLYSTASSPFEYVCSGRVDVSGIKYVVIRSPDVMDRELGLVDLQKDPTQYVRAPTRYFKNYKRMSGIRIRIEREDGSLYDTGGVTHVLLLKIQHLDVNGPTFA